MNDIQFSRNVLQTSLGANVDREVLSMLSPLRISGLAGEKQTLGDGDLSTQRSKRRGRDGECAH